MADETGSLEFEAFDLKELTVKRDSERDYQARVDRIALVDLGVKAAALLGELSAAAGVPDEPVAALEPARSKDNSSIFLRRTASNGDNAIAVTWSRNFRQCRFNLIAIYQKMGLSVDAGTSAYVPVTTRDVPGWGMSLELKVGSTIVQLRERRGPRKGKSRQLHYRAGQNVAALQRAQRQAESAAHAGAAPRPATPSEP